MSRIFFDTNLFIYLTEGKGEERGQVRQILGRAWERGDQIVTSALTVGELLTKPLAAQDTHLVKQYEEMLRAPAVDVIAFDRRCAIPYALVRQDKSIKLPDAIQLACASASKCDLFITNDERLSRKIVPGIHFISSLSKAMI